MSAEGEATLLEQGTRIRARLQAQRRAIALQLDPVASARDRYPRSKTLRFLTRRPALAATVLAEVASLLLGARVLRVASRTIAVARLLRSI